LKNNLESVGWSALALSASKTINLMLSVITSMFLSRYLTLVEYGTYSELQTITSLVVSVFALGLPSSINYFLASCKLDYKRKFLSFYYSMITIISICVAILMFFSKTLIAQYYNNPTLTLYSFFLVVIPWTKITISSRSNMLIVDTKLRKELIYSIANSALLFLITLFVVMSKTSMYVYLWLYVVVEVVFSILSYTEACYSAEKTINVDFDKSLLKSVIFFSVPLGLSTAISTLSLDLDKLIIGYFMNEESVAIYANAGKELPFSLISTSFSALVLPKVVKNIKEGNKELSIDLWKNSSELCFIIFCFFACASIVFAPQIITFLYSDTYLSGTRIFRIYSLILLLRITYWGMILNAYGKTKQILYNSLICLGVNLILSIILYFFIGFEGPALASLISIAIMSIAQVFSSSRLIKMPVRRIFPWANMLKEFTVCVLTAIIFQFVLRLIGMTTTLKGIVSAIIIGIVWALVYFFVMSKRIKQIWKQIY